MLTEDSGLQNGLMMAQYTAAALASDNKTLAHPDSVDSIPTGANQEDHVSMGANAARHARQIVWNCERIVAIEMLCAAQALDYRMAGAGSHEGGQGHNQRDAADGLADHADQHDGAGPRLGPGTAAAHRFLRASGLAPLTEDRVLAPDIELVAQLIHSGEIAKAVEASLAARGSTSHREAKR